MATNERGFKLDRLGHAVLRVRDLGRSERFYRDVLGLEVRRRIANRMVFFTCGELDHDLAIVELGPDAPLPEDGRVGLYHLAFRLADVEALRAAYHHCLSRGVQIAGVNHHGSSRSVYVKDPDGIEIELYCDAEPGPEADEAALRSELQRG